MVAATAVLTSCPQLEDMVLTGMGIKVLIAAWTAVVATGDSRDVCFNELVCINTKCSEGNCKADPSDENITKAETEPRFVTPQDIGFQMMLLNQNLLRLTWLDELK